MLLKGEHEESIDKGFLLSELKRIVDIRNQMGGSLYWNVVNDDCIKLSKRCIGLGVARSDITSIMES